MHVGGRALDLQERGVERGQALSHLDSSLTSSGGARSPSQGKVARRSGRCRPAAELHGHSLEKLPVQAHAVGAVGRNLDQAGGSRGARTSSGDRATVCGRPASAATRRELDPARRGDVLLVRRRAPPPPPPAGSRRCPPPPLFTQTIVSSAPARRAASRPPRSCSSASSPVSRKVGRPLASAAPAAEETTPSIPFAPAVGQEAQRLRGLGEEGLDVAHGHRRGQPQQGIVRAAPAPAPRRPSARTGPARRPAAGGTSASAARHDASQSGSRRGAQHLERGRQASHAGAAAAWTSCSALRVGSCQAAWGSSTTCGQAASQARSGFEVGVSPTRSTSSGACCGGEALGAKQHVVVGDHVRAVVGAAAYAGGRLGQHRPAGLRGQPGHAARPPARPSGPQTIAPRGARGDALGQLVHVVGVRSARVLAQLDPGPSVRPALPVGGVELLRRRAPAARAAGSSGAPGPGRPPTAVQNARQARARWWTAESRPGSWLPTSTNHLAAEPYSLIWSIACPAPTSRSSGGRSAVSTISGTRASRASATAGSRLAAAVPLVQVTATGRPLALAMPEGHEAGRALVDHRRALDPVLGGQRQDERRVARPGAGDRAAQTAARELVDEGLKRRVGAVDRDHAGAMRRCVFIPGFMQPGDAWSPVAERLPERYPSALLDHREHTYEGRLREIAEAGEGAVIVGYSIGGRLALHAALREPGRYARPRDGGRQRGHRQPRHPLARGARRTRGWPAWMETAAIEEIVAIWERQPLFADQSDALVDAQRPGRLAQDPRSLASLLRTRRAGRARPGLAAARPARPPRAGDRRARSTTATRGVRGGWPSEAPRAQAAARRERRARRPPAAAGRGGRSS